MFTSRFSPASTPAATQVSDTPESAMITGAQSSISAQAAAVLEALKNPLEQVAHGGVMASGVELVGYYSAHKSFIRRPDGTKLMASRLGGRFFFSEEMLTDYDKAELDKLVKKELAFYVTNDAAE